MYAGVSWSIGGVDWVHLFPLGDPLARDLPYCPNLPEALLGGLPILIHTHNMHIYI